MRIEDWIKELPEYGPTIEIAQLCDEREALRKTLENGTNRLLELEVALTQKVERLWTPKEIAEAKERFLDKSMDGSVAEMDRAVRAGRRHAEALMGGRYVPFDDPVNPPRS